MAINHILPGQLDVNFRHTQHVYTKVNYTKSGIHGGIDVAPKISGTRGLILYAPHEGYIDLETGGDYGNHLRITSQPYNQEGEARQSLLAHCERFLVQNARFVAQGQPVAIMGGAPGMAGAGRSTGVHCHWEYHVYKGGRWVLTDHEPFLCYWIKTTA